MEMTPAEPPPRAARPQIPAGGVILILLGALFLVAQLGGIRVGQVIVRWWPLILIVIGATQMVNARSVRAGFTLFLVGSILILFTQSLISWRLMAQFWPVVLIVIGLSIVFGGRARR